MTGFSARTRNRTRFALSGLPRRFERIVDVLWPEQHYLRYPSAAAALTSIRIHQTGRPT